MATVRAFRRLIYSGDMIRAIRYSLVYILITENSVIWNFRNLSRMMVLMICLNLLIGSLLNRNGFLVEGLFIGQANDIDMRKLNGKQPDMQDIYHDPLDGISLKMWECVKPVLKKDGLPLGIIIFGTGGGK